MMSRLLGVVAFSLVSLGAAALAGPSRDKRIEFQEKQRPLRIKYKLSDAAASAKYPAADLFIGPEKIVSPGEVVTITAEGKAAKGSLFVFNCDDVQILSIKHTAKAVTVKAKVGAFALPRHCALIAVTPVSVETLEIPALEITGTYTFNLELANGMSTVVTIRPGAKGPQTRSVWKTGATDIGERATTTTFEDEVPKLHFEIGRDNSDIAATKAALEADPKWKEASAFEAEREALYVEREGCATVKNPTARQDCTNRVNAKLDKLQVQARRNNGLRTTADLRREHDLQHPHACNSIALTVDTKGKVTGVAGACAGTNSVDVTGSVTVEKRTAP